MTFKSTRSITTLIFDWDGTLVDSAHLGLVAYERTFAELGFPFSDTVYETSYSPNWYTVYEALALPRDRWQLADDLWRRHYREQNAELVDGAAVTLLELHRKRYRLGVVTSGNEDRVCREIEQASLTEILDAIISADHIATTTPD